MSEFEYYEAAVMASSVISNSAMDFTYLVFAYIVACHLAGKMFPQFVARLASIVFTLSLIGPMLGVISGIGQLNLIGSEYQLAFPEGGILQEFLVDSALIYTIIVTPLIVGWVSSILFLHLYVRGNRRENEKSDT